MIQESRIHWLSVGQEHSFQVQITGVSGTQGTEEEIYAIRNFGAKSADFDGGVQAAIIVGMDLDRRRIVRQDYTVLDWLSHLGGLEVALVFLLGGVFAVLQLNVFENFLV